jgi:ABC-type sugar transport system ATPase subunit
MVLRMVAGLEEPTRGKIYIGDRAVNDLPPKDRDIAMVFQEYARLGNHFAVLIRNCATQIDRRSIH